MQPKALVTLYLIIVFPDATPLTIPPASIVAIAGVRLDHTPPNVAFDKVVVLPSHTDNVPVIAATLGLGFTVTCTVTVVLHPKPFVTV